VLVLGCNGPLNDSGQLGAAAPFATPPGGSTGDDVDGGGVNSGDDHPIYDASNDTGEFTVHPDLTFPEDHPCFDDVVFDEDREFLVFSFSCDVSDLGWEAGKYVVGVTDGGYLRQIATLSRDGDEWTLGTTYAGLGDVVANANLDFTWSPEGGARGPMSLPIPEIEFGDDVPVKITGGEIGFDGSIGYGVTWRWFRIREANLDMTFEPYVELRTETVVHEALASGSWTKNIADWHMGTLTMMIGPVPVVMQFKMRQKATATVSLPGEVTVEANASVRIPMETHAQYVRGNGWTHQSDWDIHASVEMPTVEVDTEATVKVAYVVQPVVLFYGVAGPALSAEPYLKGTLGPDCDGIDAEVAAGVDFKLSLAAMYEKEGRRDTSSFANWDIGNFERPLWETTLSWPFGVVFPGCGEVCGNGTDDDGDGLIDCQDVDDCGTEPTCSGTCGVGESISCGQTISKTAADFAGASDVLDAYNCNVGNYDGGEFVFEWTAPSGSEVSFELVDPEPTQTNMDLMVLDASMGCHGNACVDWGLNSMDFEPTAGQTYYLVVDGYDSDMGDFSVTLDCAP
jgi:hypothetical protein